MLPTQLWIQCLLLPHKDATVRTEVFSAFAGDGVSCLGQQYQRARQVSHLLGTDSSQHTCFWRLPGSQVQGWNHLSQSLHCYWWSTESPLQSASAISIRICIHYCQNVQIVIKILMKENQQPFISREEQLLTAFISRGCQRKPEEALSHHAVSVFWL